MNIDLPPIRIERPDLAVNHLAERSGLSKTLIKDAMSKGAVWLTQKGKRRRLRRAKSEVQPGDELAFYYDESIIRTVPETPVLIDDQHQFSVWIKPAGVTSGGTRYGDHCAIDRIIERQLDRPCFLVHRLDRFAWGLMVLAHSKRAAADISDQFQARTVSKHYEAIIWGEINDPLKIDEPIEGKTAISHITPLRHNPSGNSAATLTRIAVNIETGRKHQIRRHLSQLGHPIVGDRQYGGYRTGRDTTEKTGVDLSTLVDTGLQLASVSLAFRSPTGNEASYVLPDGLKPKLPAKFGNF